MTSAQLRTARGACLEVQGTGPADYLIQGGHQPHHVTLDPVPQCSCPDFRFRRVACKHLRAVSLRQGDPAAWAELAAFIRAVWPHANRRRRMA